MKNYVFRFHIRAVQTLKYGLVATILGSIGGLSTIAAPQGRSSDVSAMVTQSPRDLPVVAQADVIVAGGGVAGVVAALQAAETGRSVVLLESRNYYGQELTATDRCTTFEGAPPTSLPLARALLEEMGKKGVIRGDRLDPKRLRALLVQKIVAQPRITPYFFAQPTEVVSDGGRVHGVIFASRDGRQVALAPVVIDATEDARLAASAGARFVHTWKGNNTARRYIAIASNAALAPGNRSVPARFDLQGERVVIHPGYIELAIDANIGPDIAVDLSKYQARTFAASFLIRDYLETEGIKFEEFSPAFEAWFDRVPVVACREPLRESEISTLDFSRLSSVQPEGVEGLLIAGRTVAADDRLAGLASLMCTGELAGRSAAETAIAARPADLHLLTSKKSLPPEDMQSLRVAEYLHGIEADRSYPLIRTAARQLPVRGEFDVVVAGGGTSGAIAAISAARSGARVAVLEILPNLGGISSNRVNSYYWGNPAKSLLRQELGTRIKLTKSDFPGGLEKVGFSGDDKKYALQDMALAAGVQIYYQTLVAGAVVDGSQVKGVVAENAAGRHVLLAKVVIDTTGRAAVAVAAGAGSAKGRSTDGFLHEIEHGPLRDPTNLRDVSRSYLLNQSEAPSMNIRESRRVIGDYVVTFDDAVHERVFPDIICRWRSNYDTHFPNSANMTEEAQNWVAILGQWRRPISGTIPYRSILPQGLDNILVAAMAYSTDHDMLTAARMQQDMEHLGEAAGVAAAMSARRGVAPRQLPVREIQTELVRRGVLEPKDVPGIATSGAPSQESLHQQDFWRAERERAFPPDAKPIPLEGHVSNLGTPNALESMVQLYLAGTQSAPLLRPLLAADRIEVREEAAVILGLIGDRSAIPALLGFLQTRNLRTFEFKLPGASSRSSVPLFWSSIILLGRFGEKAAAPLMEEMLAKLSPSDPSFGSTARGLRQPSQIGGSPASFASFLITSLGRIGDPKAIPVIRPFLKVARPLHIKDENIDFEVAWGVRSNAAVALASLGDLSGLPVLVELLESQQSLLHQYAERLLESITGQRLGPESGPWREWLRQTGVIGSHGPK
ncbi:MAG: FAD-dependent oxidoreductase [Opitutaceae bacterium]|nr:FAD-dependent oxidoreductase [Opitutaceae bacterium]